MTTRRDITWRQGALLSELLPTDVDLTGRSLRCHVRRRKSDSTIMLAFESAGPADQRITAEAEGVRITLGAVAGETVQTGGRDQPWVYDIEAVLDADPEDVIRTHEGAWIVSADVTRDGTQSDPTPDADLRYLRDANLAAGSGVTLTPSGAGASRTITIAATGGGGAAVWGGITGTLSAQTDLQSALDGKVGTGDSRLSDARTPTAHTHPLSDLQQSGAANGQVAQWSGSAWVPATPSGGTKTLARFVALDNQPPASAFATIDTRNSVAVLDFDDATVESAVFVSVIPDGADLTYGLSVALNWMATSATTGNVRWRVAFERTGTDLDADSFDTATEANGAANNTSGVETVTTIAATSDGLTAGDRFRLRVSRVGNDGTNDTMVGDAELVSVEVRSA